MRAALLSSLCLTMGLAAQACTPDASQALQQLNALRAEARACGARRWPAAPPLRSQPLLAAAAQRHAQELARRDRIDHMGEAGASLRTRLREAGYVMRVAGENLAGGPETLDEVLAQWLASPAHCENLMVADFEEFGLACVSGPGKLQRYWVLELAAPAALRSSPGR